MSAILFQASKPGWLSGGVVALAARKDRGDEVLDAPLNGARRDVEAVQRGADEEAAVAEVLPDRKLAFPEAGFERLDMLGGDVEDDGDRFHPDPPSTSPASHGL